MDDIWPILARVLVVFGIMGAGALARALNWLTSEADRSLMKLTVNLLLPCLLFHKLVTDDRLSGSDMIFPPIVGFGTVLLGFFVGVSVLALLGRVIGFDGSAQKRAFVFCVGMYNYVYLPLPIAEQLFPSAVSTLMIFNVGVEIAMWTIGVMVLTGGTTSWPGALKRIINPPLMSIVAALVVRGLVRSEFLPVDVSSALAPTVHHLMNAVKIVGDCGVPMGLILSGAIMLELLREADWRFGWKPFGVAAGLRLLVLPAIMLVIARFAPIDVDLKRVLLLQAAMPSASFSIVLVRLYGQDAQVALKIVVGTTLLALFTIPIWLIVGRTWLGV